MSTRSVIGRVGANEGEFKGIYVHWDGSPSTRGPLLLKIIREQFKGSLKGALVYLIDRHPAGWSSVGEACYCHPAQSKRDDFKNRKPEPAQVYTHKNLEGGTDIEWVYIFDEENHRMFVRDVEHGAESIVELDGDTPDWERIECGDNLERCSHVAEKHFPNMPEASRRLSTLTYLGKRDFDFHDAVGFIISGRRYASTGSGGNSNYFNQHGRNGKIFPNDTWVSTVKSGNRRSLDIPTAQLLPDGKYVPLPKVVWVMPPTSVNPNETLVSA